MSFSELAKIDIFLAGSKLAALSFLTTSDVFPWCCRLVSISYSGYTRVIGVFLAAFCVLEYDHLIFGGSLLLSRVLFYLGFFVVYT